MPESVSVFSAARRLIRIDCYSNGNVEVDS